MTAMLLSGSQAAEEMKPARLTHTLAGVPACEAELVAFLNSNANTTLHKVIHRGV